MLPIQKKNTVRAYRWIINKFCTDFGGEDLTELSSEKILHFFNIVTEGCKPQTKRVRFSHLSSFFNFLKNNLDLNFENPCDLPVLRVPSASVHERFSRMRYHRLSPPNKRRITDGANTPAGVTAHPGTSPGAI